MTQYRPTYNSAYPREARVDPYRHPPVKMMHGDEQRHGPYAHARVVQGQRVVHEEGVQRAKVVNAKPTKETLSRRPLGVIEDLSGITDISNVHQNHNNAIAAEQKSKKRRREVLTAQLQPVEVVAVPVQSYSEPQLMEEYRTDIIRHLKSSEKAYAPTNYVRSLSDITDNNRTVLVDWLIEIHYKYRMLPETIYLCISLLDRYLFLRPETRRRQVQVVGTCCLLLASKFEEVDSAPSIPDLVAVMGEAGTTEDVRRCECDIANTLEFNFIVATPYQFLLIFALEADVSHTSELFFLSMFFLDCTLLDAQFLVLTPQQRAASSFYLACCKMKVVKNWDRIWAFGESEVRYWASALNSWFPRYRNMAVFRKFSRPSYKQAVQRA